LKEKSLQEIKNYLFKLQEITLSYSILP